VKSNGYCRRFDPGGSLDRRVNCRCVSLPRWVGGTPNYGTRQLWNTLVRTKQSQEATHETRDFYPVVWPSNTCLLPCCGVPMDEGYTQPLSSDPMINLNTMAFFLIVFLPFARNLHRLESLALTILSQENHRNKRGRATHARLKSAAHTHTSRDLSSKHSTESTQLKRSSNH
jgi:hypothetical protein